MSLPVQLKVTFKCKRSGNTVSFTSPEDIKGLRIHEGYTEVIEEKQDEKEVKETSKTEVLIPEFTIGKKRGRPSKI